jgi:hypothetical protein
MTDEKMRNNLEKDIQNKIKEMRMGKKVIDDDALQAVEAEIDAENYAVNHEENVAE